MKPSWMPALYFVVGQAGWFARVSQPRQECKFLAFVVATGTLWDSALVRLHLLGYPSGFVVAGFAPYWIIALWALFGGQFNTTYNWLKCRPAVAALLGAIAGPVSFRAGASLGAVQFIRPIPAALTLAVGWAVILPLLVFVSRRWDGVRAPSGS
jgi:hypothetical protein